jgi:hypothetical protein
MKRFAIYPVLFVLAYILSRLSGIKDQIDPAGMIRPVIIAIVLTLIILAFLSWALKSGQRAGFVFILFAMVMFFYGEIYTRIAILVGVRSSSLSLFVFIALLGLLYLFSSQRVWELIPFPDIVTYYLNVVFIFLFLFQAAQVSTGLYNLIKKGGGDNNAQFSSQAQIKLSGDTRPDIYIIVLDAYARADVLESIYQYDNTKFLSDLEKRGFYVASQSHSNYVQTKQTLGSLLNLDYIPALKPSEDYFSYYHLAITNNRIFSLLKQIGYQTTAFDSGFTFSAIPNADIYYSNFLPLSDFESYLLMGTPIEMLSNNLGLGIPTYTYQSHRERVLYTFKTLQNIPESSDPKVVFAHILSPHPPFVFDQNGNPIEPGSLYQMFDGVGSQGKKEDYWRGYRDQVVFVNDQVLQTVDAILEKSKTPPVIILMGDHGPGSMFKTNMQDPGCLWERTSNLVALLLPGYPSDPRLYPSISPVNASRLVFDLYFNADLPLLEDKTFLTSDAEPYALKDITQESQSRQPCLSPNTPP